MFELGYYPIVRCVSMVRFDCSKTFTFQTLIVKNCGGTDVATRRSGRPLSHVTFCQPWERSNII